MIYFNLLYIINEDYGCSNTNCITASNTWIVPAVTGEGPAAREGHSATLVDKRLFIFGGCGKSSNTQQEEYYNDLYILDTGYSSGHLLNFLIYAGLVEEALDIFGKEIILGIVNRSRSSARSQFETSYC